jgi:hypothetical protein
VTRVDVQHPVQATLTSVRTSVMAAHYGHATTCRGGASAPARLAIKLGCGLIAATILEAAVRADCDFASPHGHHREAALRAGSDRDPFSLVWFSFLRGLRVHLG